MSPKILQISEDDPDFHKVHQALLQKIKQEVAKLDLTEKANIAKILVDKLESILKEAGITSMKISSRIKEQTSITDKVIRKIHKFIDLVPETPLNELVSQITVEKIRGNLFDLIGIRVILKPKKECYDLLEQLGKQPHFHLLEAETKDYIRQAKENGYQALHAVLKDKPSGKHFEIQIMTVEMATIAEQGSAKRKEYTKEKGNKFFRNMAILVAGLAATGAIIYSVNKSRKQKKSEDKKD